jgi:hypothetical protein
MMIASMRKLDGMGSTGKAASVLLLLCSIFERPLRAESEPIQARYGKVEVESSEDASTHSVRVNGSVVFEYEGRAVSLEAYLSGGKNDWVLAELQSGGIACPFQYRLIELGEGRAPVTTNEFGSCGSWDTADVQGGAVVVRILGYAPHPELLSRKDLRRIEHLTETFTWSQGKLERSETTHP